MTWQERLQPASFRGVPFKVDSSERISGRRIARHQFLRREDAFHEDLGQQTPRFRFSAFVVGDDHDEDAQLLVDACEQRGPGVLSHPKLGLVNVVCSDVREMESRTELRITRLEMTFERHAEQDIPESTLDEVSAAKDASDDLWDASALDFVQKMQVNLVPEFVRAAATGAMRVASQTMRGLDVFSGAAQDLAALDRSLTRLVDDAASLVTAPANLAFAIRESVQNIAAASANAVGSFAAYRVFLDTLSATSERGTSAMTLAANANAEAVVNLFQQGAIAQALVAGVDAPWESLQQATKNRDAIAAKIDELAETASDPVYQSLMLVRSQLVNSIPRENQQIPSIRTIILPQSTPSLVLAYQLYDDIGRADEIVARNGIENPAFLPAGTPLEVLSV